jgi:murein L,D-transpeptidase YcbB/YkuD
VIGPATEGALREPLRTRVEQIAGAIAHLDARPPLDAERMIVVHIPMFQLWAWDAGEDRPRLAFASRVIVGRPATPTPVFDAPIQDVVFRPEWNVPHSIVRNEIVPRLAREPDYLQRAGLELVPPGGAGRSPAAVSAETLAALRAGSMRLRQPPGPGNALGLAVWLLDDESEWPAERVRSAMEGTASSTVAVRRPVPVRLVYLGAMVWPNGAVHFAEDVYRRADRFSATGCPS